MDDKLTQVFEAARGLKVPSVPEGFEDQVMRAVYSKAGREAAPAPLTVFDHLDLYFPRAATAAVLAIGIFVAIDLAAALVGEPDLTASVAQFSDQWLFAVKGF
jgi:anti-sigma factor RsiW